MNYCRLPESGIVLASIGAVSLAMQHLSIGVLTSEMHPLQISACSDAPVGLIALIYCLITKISLIPEPGERIYSAVYVVALSVCIVSMDFSLSFVSPFDSEAIIATNIIFVAAMATIFLSEPIDFIDLIMLGVAFVGVIFISKPSFLFQKTDGIQVTFSKRLRGSLLALLTSFSMAILMCTNRRIHETNAFTLIYSAFGLTGIVSWIVVFSTGSFPINLNGWTTVVLLICVIFSGMITQYLVIRATQVESATSVSLVVMLNMPLILVLQLVFLRIVPDLYSFVGAIFITFVIFVTSTKPIVYRRYGIERNGICLKRRQSIEDNVPYESIEENENR